MNLFWVIFIVMAILNITGLFTVSWWWFLASLVVVPALLVLLAAGVHLMIFLLERDK